MKLSKQHLVLGVLGLSLFAGSAYAATQSVTANMSFDAAVALSKTADINFGIVQSLTAGTYTITPAGVVTPTAGGVLIGGTSSAASITVSGSASQTVAISTGTYASDNGVSVSNATCSYDGGSSTSCDSGLSTQSAPGVGKVLRVGVTATADGNQTAGSTASPTFVVTVVYG